MVKQTKRTLCRSGGWKCGAAGSPALRAGVMDILGQPALSAAPVPDKGPQSIQ